MTSVSWRPASLTTAAPGTRAVFVRPKGEEVLPVALWAVEEGYLDRNPFDQENDHTALTGERRVMAYVMVPEAESVEGALPSAEDFGRNGWRVEQGLWGYVAPGEALPEEDDLAAFREVLLEEEERWRSRKRHADRGSGA
jgi:hypothetical protein